MINNPNVIFQIGRQANVIFRVTTAKGVEEQYLNRRTEAIVFSHGGNTYLEVRQFATDDAIEPAMLTTYVNPAKWEQIGGPDPDFQAPA